MTTPIERYALIGDTQTAALVGDDGYIDWLCVPRFDWRRVLRGAARRSGATAIGASVRRQAARATRRRYRDGTLVLETEWDTPEGTVRLVDCMPVRDEHIDMVRIVEGISGRVPMTMDLTVRFDYGSILPWVRTVDAAVTFVERTHALRLRDTGPGGRPRLPPHATFEGRGRRPGAVRAHRLPSTRALAGVRTPSAALERTEAFWSDWSAGSTYERRLARPGAALARSRSRRSPTRRPAASSPRPRRRCPSGSAACATGTTATAGCATRRSPSTRCMGAGFHEEARAWRDWLLRAVAGDPAHLQIMYGAAGERRLTSTRSTGSRVTSDSKPVRVGNAAHRQFQLDVYGEVLDALHQARCFGVDEDPNAWAVKPRCSSSSSRGGASPTRASGRCAATRATSCTPR